MSKSSFNYAALENTDARTAARDHARQIKSQLERSTAAMIDVGKRLNQVRDMMTGSEFQTWLRTEFQWSQSTASEYMRAATRFGELDCVPYFQPTALFVLARENVTDGAVADAVKIAESRNVVTRKAAKEIVQRHGIEPIRADAGVARRTAAPSQIPPVAPTAIFESTAAELTIAVDAFCRRLDEITPQLPIADRQNLADRLFSAAEQLRRSAQPDTPAAPPSNAAPAAVPKRQKRSLKPAAA